MRLPTLTSTAVVAVLLLAGVGFLPPSATAQAPEPSIREAVEELSRQHRETNDAVRETRALLDSLPVTGELTAEPVGDDEPIEVTIQGPDEVAQGGFALIGSGPANATLRWRIQSPEGASEPLRLRDESGAPVLAFFSPSSGRYVVTLTAQVPVEGLDPFGEFTHVVTVGTLPPVPPVPPTPPVPPVPPVPPAPDLTGTAKVVYEAARGIDKAVLAQASNAYGSQVSAINAGAYNSLSLDAAKQQIVEAITGDNPPRNAAPALFDAIDGELQKREEAGQLASLAAVSAALAEITTGLEAALR